jgi:8-oxo-dGTP diphosphatase
MSENKTVRVVAGIVVEAGRVLIAQRPHPQSFALRWEFPGGKMEPGESPEHALDREFQEELGIRIQAVREYGEIRYSDPSGRDLRVQFFLARRREGTARPVQVEAVDWVEAADLPEVDFIPANREIVSRVVEDIREGRLG